MDGEKTVNQSPSEAWASRTVLYIPTSAMKMLKKDRAAQMMKGGKWYQLIPDTRLSVRVGKKSFSVNEAKAEQIIKILGDK